MMSRDRDLAAEAGRGSRRYPPAARACTTDNEGVSTLDLVPVPRSVPMTPGQANRARDVHRLREPLEQLDFEVDGSLLSEQLRYLEVPDPDVIGLQSFDFLSVGDLAWPEEAVSSLRQLAGVEPRSPYWPLEPGRLPLYVCPMCADLGCGALTVEVVQEPDVVTWRDFRLEDGITREDRIDLGAFGPITFRASQYAEALLQPIPLLEALVADEAAAKAAWEQARRPAGLLRQLVRRR